MDKSTISKYVSSLTLLITLSLSNRAIASADLLNIKACLDKAENYATQKLDAVPEHYDNNWFTKDVVTWTNAKCEVSAKNVDFLMINDEIIIFKEFAGEVAYDLHIIVSDVTTRAKAILENRLEQNEKLISLQVKISELSHDRSRLYSIIQEAKGQLDGIHADSYELKNIIADAQKQTLEIEGKIGDLENKVKNSEELRDFKRKTELLVKIDKKVEATLRQPFPEPEKVKVFAENSVNKVLKIDNSDETNYFEYFTKTPSVNDEFYDLEKELNNL